MDKVIGIDVFSALHQPRGMGIYTINFLKELAKIDTETKYILYADIEDKDNILPKQSNFELKVLPSKGLFNYEQIVLPKQCKKDKIDILHSPANTSPVFLDRHIKRIITLHDVMFLKKQIPLSKNKKQVLGRLYYTLTALFNVRKAARIITPTEFSKQDIIKELKINPDKIVVDTRGGEHFDTSAATAFDELKSKYNIPEKYFFHVGGNAPTKNTEKLLEIFSKNKELNIVIAGIRVLETSHLYKKYGKYKNIVFVPYISQADIVGLYSNAQAFIFPSMYEGFGLPLLEAMKCNCPILASNTTCIPEVAGDAALYFNPENYDEIIKCINLILDNNVSEKIRKAEQEQLKKYSWANAVKCICEVYKNVS